MRWGLLFVITGVVFLVISFIGGIFVGRGGVVPPSTGGFTYCTYLVDRCTFNAERQRVAIHVANNTPVKFTSGTGPPVKILISQKDCVSIAGTTVDPDPNDFTFDIPLKDGPWPPGLSVSGAGNCGGNPTFVSAHPELAPFGGNVPEQCGCKLSQ